MADLRCLFTPGGVHELRVPNAGRFGTISGYFDNPGALMAAAGQLDGESHPGVYFSLNPVNPALLARCANTIQRYTKTGGTTADHDIDRRRWVPVDLDPVRPTNIPSTDAEHKAAWELAEAIAGHLRGLGWADPVTADSGNGAYLLYPVDLPNDEAATALVKGFLAALAAKFDNGTVKVDQQMPNASRIIRVPGTTNRKGSGTADRPHRVASVIRVPELVGEVRADQLSEFGQRTSAQPSTAPAPVPGTVDAFMAPGNGYDLEGFLARHLPDAKPHPDNGGTVWTIPVCPFNPDHARGEAWVGRRASGMLHAGCQHNTCTWRWADLRAKFEPGQPSTPSTPTSDQDGWAGALAREVARQRLQRVARRALDAEEQPPADPPEMLTLAERLTRPRPALVYRVDGWQPTGSRVVLAAQFKAGKTTLVGNLVRSLVDGNPFLGRHLVAPVAGTVAVLDFEMSEHQLDTWLEDQKIRNPDQVMPVPLRGRGGAFDILDPERRAEWATRLRQAGVAYVVLDCLRPVLDAFGLDEHRDAGRFLVALDALLGEAGVGEAAVIHHMGHANERSRGDSRIRDWPDVEWRLVRQDDNPASPRYLSGYGRDVDQPEAQLDFDPDTRHLTLVGGTRGDAAKRGALGSVIEVLRGTPEMSGRAIEDSLDGMHGRNAVRRALAYGLQSGALSRRPGERRAHLYSIVASVNFDPDLTEGGGVETPRGQSASAPECAGSGGALAQVSAPQPLGRRTSARPGTRENRETDDRRTDPPAHPDPAHSAPGELTCPRCGQSVTPVGGCNHHPNCRPVSRCQGCGVGPATGGAA